MARRIPFSLKMADGAAVRTIEELREHFDLASALGYYEDGRLSEWLVDRYYDDEADKVGTLDKSSEDFKKNLCDILGAPYSGNEADQLHLSSIARNNEHRERLKQFTADDAILAVADRVAFTQHELEGLLDKGVKEIYLWGNDGAQFIIPGRREGITYIGLNHPMVKFDGEIVAPNIDFQDLEVNINDYIDGSGDDIEFYQFFANNRILGVKLLRMAAEKESVAAQTVLGVCYRDGFGVKKDLTESVKMFQKAAEQGHLQAQYELGIYYANENERHYAYETREAAREWLRKAAEQGHMEAQYQLGCIAKSVKWYKEAAEQGHAKAQYMLGRCYDLGDGVNQDYEKARMWYRKAAEQGYAEAQYGLGDCFLRDWRLDGHVKKEAMEWLRKAAEQGHMEAMTTLAIYCNSDKEALMWTRKAAEQGDAESLRELGDRCYSGKGVDENKEEALKWYRKAAKQGSILAELKLKQLFDIRV